MNFTDTMISHAAEILLEHFSLNGPQRPGELEDDFAGGENPNDRRITFMEHPLSNWRSSIFFPALKALVKGRKVAWGRHADGDIYYALPGFLPEGVTEEHDD